MYEWLTLIFLSRVDFWLAGPPPLRVWLVMFPLETNLVTLDLVLIRDSAFFAKYLPSGGGISVSRHGTFGVGIH
jgi:hypothetical protein